MNNSQEKIYEPIYGTVWINQSNLKTIQAERFYTSLKLNDAFFLFDEYGKRVSVDENKEELEWKAVDRVVMFVRITGSLLDTVTTDKIYRVFNDEENDERYIWDENKEKVLFDRMLFQYEVL